jgi:hypothetical protein
MTDVTTPTPDAIDWEEKANKLPEMLNVLTILTFVGCGIGLIFSILAFTGAQKNYDNMVDLQGKMESAPAFSKSMMGPDPVGLAQKSLENRTPMLLLGLVGIALCLYGAIQMRKRKKTGFTIYVIGQIVPFLPMFIFIGIGLFSTFSLALAFAFPIIFVILYASQLKHLS